MTLLKLTPILTSIHRTLTALAADSTTTGVAPGLAHVVRRHLEESKRKGDLTMVSQQRSFHLIECPTSVSSSPAHLVVNGRGMPHEALTAFYEELQKMHWVPAREGAVQAVLSFFSFLEQPDQGVEMAASPHEPCSSRPSALGRSELPPATSWAGPTSEIKVAIRAYLFARWGCLTRSRSPDEEMVLSPSARATGEIRRFLAVLRHFYRFAIERQDYCYDGNPVTAFRIPPLSRI
jgi:hypothetical protein